MGVDFLKDFGHVNKKGSTALRKVLLHGKKCVLGSRKWLHVGSSETPLGY